MAFIIELGEEVTIGKREDGTPIKEFKSAGFYNLRKLNSAGHPDGPNIVNKPEDAYRFETKEQALNVQAGDSRLRPSRIDELV